MKKKTKESFFMHISFLKPHPPYCVSEPWHSLIDPSKLECDISDESLDYRKKLHPLSEKIIESFEIKGNKTPEINYSKLTKKDIAILKIPNISSFLSFIYLPSIALFTVPYL